MRKRINESGFTLIEVLIVIGLIAILAAVTIIALNPAQNFADARDSERQSEITQIMNALNQWLIEPDAGNTYDDLVDGDGTSLTAATTATPPGTLGCTRTFEIYNGATAGTDEIDLSSVLATYIAEIPVDPANDQTLEPTGYTICAQTATQLTIAAPNAEDGTISISR